MTSVFVSFSGAPSRTFAAALRNWLPDVVQSVSPWMASDDLEPGAVWFTDIAQKLETTDHGILCITQENLRTPWVAFEAGALFKGQNRARVVPLLLGVAPRDLPQPLASFQARTADEAGMRALVHFFNDQSSDVDRPDRRVIDRAFERHWPDLERVIASLQMDRPQAAPLAEPGPPISAEALDLLRRIERKVAHLAPLGETPHPGLKSGSSLGRIFMDGAGKLQIRASSEQIQEPPKSRLADLLLRPPNTLVPPRQGPDANPGPTSDETKK